MIESLAFDDLSFAYPDGRPVFEHVTFEWPRAGATWVRAEKDRGRSTLLKLIMGLIEPTGGAVQFNGRATGEMSFAERLTYRLAMGYGFDMGGLLSTQTLVGNLTLPLVYHGLCDQDQAEVRVRALLDRFGLGDAADQRPHAVTGSERKLTCVLRAFVHSPEVVVLDEPLAGLKRDAITELGAFAREGFAERGLRQLLMTGDNPLLADALNARPLHISRASFRLGAA